MRTCRDRVASVVEIESKSISTTLATRSRALKHAHGMKDLVMWNIIRAISYFISDDFWTFFTKANGRRQTSHHFIDFRIMNFTSGKQRLVVR